MPILTRRLLLAGVAAACFAIPALAQAQSSPASGSSATCTNPSPNHAKLDTLVIGFSQSENEQNPFRAGETNSVRSAAKAAHVKRFLYTNANSNQAKQVSDIESMISQGAQALIVAPLDSTGLQPALAQAAAKHIPVVTIDRSTAGTVCTDFITNMGSNFYVQAQRAGEALAKATGGKAEILELQGGYGNSVETERTQGFADAIKKHPGMHILAAQSANWSTTDAQRVMEQLLLAHPNANAVYAQSDTMALGALTALRQAGKQPGKQVKIVSIDGTKDVVQAIADGRVAADVETNPRFGPMAMHALTEWFDGKPVPQKVFTTDAEYTPQNAKQALASGKPY